MTTETVPTTDEEALEYLPDSDALLYSICKGMYEVRRLQGDSVLEALMYVYKAHVGEKAERQ